MLASSSLHHFRRDIPGADLDTLALCSPRNLTVPRPYFDEAQRFVPAPVPRPPSGQPVPDARAPPGATKTPDGASDAPARRAFDSRYIPDFEPTRPTVSTITVRDHDDPDSATSPLSGAYLPHSAPPPEMANHNHMQYPYPHDQPDYVSRAPSVSPAYQDPSADRRVSTSSTGSYDAYQYNNYNRFQPARATPPMMARPTGSLTPYEYPIDPAWPGRRPSAEQSPAPPARYEEYHEEIQQVPYPLPLEHPSPMQSLGSSSSNSTGIPASPDLSLQPSGLVAAALPEGAQPPSATNPGQRTYAFVSLAGSTIRKRPRRRYDEIERLYSCSYEDCTKAYGTLNHLNAHVTMQKHGPKRNPSEFKELRKLWRTQKKAEQMANRPRRRRGVGQDDDAPHALHRTSSGSFSSPGAGYSDESDEGTPQPVEQQQQQHYGQVDQIWQPDMMHGYAGHGMGMPDEGQGVVMDRIPPNATLLQSLPPTHPSQQQHQYSGSMHPQAMAGYGTLPANNPPLMRRASDHEQFDYHRGPSGYGR